MNLEDIERLDAVQSSVGKLVEERIKNGPRLVTILGEHIPLPHSIGAFTPSEWRLIERYVANEIESVKVSTHLLGKLIKEYAVA